MRIVLFAGLFIGVAAFAVPEIARQTADRAAERAVRAAVDRMPGLHAGRVRSRGGAARIEIDDAAVEGSGWRMTVGRLDLPGAGVPVPSFVTAAYARPAAVSADNVSLTFGDTKVVVPHLEARGTDLTSQGLAALLDPADPMTLQDRLAKLTAAELAAPQVLLGSARIDNPAVDDHLTLKSVSLTDVNAGRIGAVAIDSVAFSSPNGATMTVPMETGHIGIDGIDLPLALDMATASRTEAASSLRPLFRSLSISGVVVRPDTGTTVSVGAILAGALKGRPLTLPPSDVMALLGKPEVDRTPADRQILADLVVDAVGSAAFDHVEVRDVAVAKTSGLPGTFKLARAVLDGFEVVKLGALSVENVSFGEGGTEVSLGRFVLGGYDGSAVVGLLKQQLAGSSDAMPAQMIPNRSSLALTDLHVAVPVTPGGMGTLDPTKRIVVDVPVASIGAGIDTATGAIGSRATMEMTYDVSAGAADPSYRDLVQYGLSRLDLSADYGATFDPTAKEIRLDRFSIDAQSLGQFAMSAVLGNALPDMFHAGQTRDEAMQAAQTLVFQSFTFAFANTGVIEKVLPPLAASAKVSVPLFKAQMKAQAEISVNQFMGTNPASARIIAALRTFIDTPKNLVVMVKAPAGLPISTVASAGDPKELLSALDIQVVANR